MCYPYVTHYSPCQHTYSKDIFCALAGDDPFENPEHICADIYDHEPTMDVVEEYCKICKQINYASGFSAVLTLTKTAVNVIQRNIDHARDDMLDTDGVPIENTSEVLDIGLGEPLNFNPAYALSRTKKGKGLKVSFADVTSYGVIGVNGGLEWADDDSLLGHERTHMHEVPKGLKLNDLTILQIAAWYTDRQNVGDKYGLELIRLFWAQDTDQKEHMIEKLHDWLHSEADMAMGDPNEPMDGELDRQYETESEDGEEGETDA